MKLKLSLFFYMICLLTHGQVIPKDSLTGKYKYEKVVQIQGLNQTEIYARAKDWIVRTLKSSDNAVNLDDSNKSSINATGNILLNDHYRLKNVTLNFKFNVYCKEGKYKVIIDNFILSYYYISVGDGSRMPRATSLEDGFKNEYLFNGRKETDKMYIEVNEKMKKIITELESAINTNQGSW
jgi:hypothetical protein